MDAVEGRTVKDSLLDVTALPSAVSFLQELAINGVKKDAALQKPAVPYSHKKKKGFVREGKAFFKRLSAEN